MNPKSKGFTLIELMITVAIVALITAVAVPSYRQYVMRANRADATTALLRLTASQERFYLQNNTYASAALLDDAPPAGLGFAGTERGYYVITLAPNGGGYQNGYILTATAAAGESQATDTDCQVFTVNEQGQRAAQNATNGDNTVTCWR
jgi:type IV pilus assembly protein PilE